MKAADVMTREVVTVGPEMPLAEAIRLMLEHQVSSLPVIGNDGLLIGLLTERELLHRAETGTDRHRLSWLEGILAPGEVAERYVHTHGRRVKDVMAHGVPTVAGSCPLDKVVKLLESRSLRRIPVVDDGRLVGIISRSGLVRALGHILDGTATPAKRDDEIRAAILAEIARNRWIECRQVEVTVSGGVVELRGAVHDPRMREALRVMAEGLPGVKSVKDNLAFVDPNAQLAYGV
jgi:CBS domain-containing protein